MRVWDLPPSTLCRAHLLGEHRELHAVWNILTLDKTGYRRHPETLRWVGALKALYRRHDRQVAEMTRRGYAHRSPLNAALATGRRRPLRLVDSLREQRRLLKRKGCACASW